MVKVFREAKRYVKKNKKRIEKQFIVDTLFTTLFWLIVHACKDYFIVQLTPFQVLMTAVTGIVFNLALSGVYGQCLNFVRREAGYEQRKT